MAHSAAMNVMMATAAKTGRALRRDFGEIEKLQSSRYGPGEFVSKALEKATRIIREELGTARPNYGFLMPAEEIDGSDKTHRWLIDPLNGAVNFAHGIPHFAMSLALEREGAVAVGVVYNPITDELFCAEQGRGALFHGQDSLRVSARANLADAVLGCDIPMTDLPDMAGMRHFGAPALELAFVAGGRLDGFLGRELTASETAAGVLLVREAGGMVTEQPDRLIAANPTLHDMLLK